MIAYGAKVQFDPFQEITGFASEDNRGNPICPLSEQLVFC